MILNNTEKLRKMIIEHPELPIVVIAGQNASNEDYSMFCSYVQVEIGEFLDCKVLNDKKAYTDREELREDMEDFYYSNFDGTDSEFDEYIDKKLDNIEEYWTDCIILYVDN